MSLLLLAFACAPTPLPPADTATGGADTTLPTGADDSGPVAEAPAWSEVFPILEERCGDCHESDYIGHFVYRGDAEATWAALVDGRALTDPGRRYVVPGDLASSLLIEKIGDDPGLGESMPPAAETPLSETESTHLVAWVAGGAPG